ncbi:MAG: DUF2608 domain-containing protein [Candidatus Paracaedibacteraceae bacterium]|nr:DUF2608 domain-containing protein [Candidatus Paracaedibacteraceae bacterium]
MVYSLSLANRPPHLFVTVNSLHEAKDYLSGAHKNSLLLIDVDSTLTMPSDPYLRRHAIQNHKKIYIDLVANLTANQNRFFKHLMVMESSSQLVENDWPSLIIQLQARGIKILAFTAAKTGPIQSIISSFPDWRYEELRRLGMDFSTAFPESILFTELQDFGNDHPGIEKGIVYCGHQLSKGELVRPVLKALKFTPSLIILIDDKWENLEAVSQAIQQSFPTINFIGIHYKAMDYIEKPLTDERIFRQRFKSLVEKAKEIAF